MTAPKQEEASVISMLKEKNSPATDNIGNKILKFFPKNLVSFLCIIINVFMRLHYFLCSWKLATVICFPNAGKHPQHHSSYFPISLLPSLIRVTKKIINSHRLLCREEYLEKNTLRLKRHGIWITTSRLYFLLWMTL